MKYLPFVFLLIAAVIVGAWIALEEPEAPRYRLEMEAYLEKIQREDVTIAGAGADTTMYNCDTDSDCMQKYGGDGYRPGFQVQPVPLRPDGIPYWIKKGEK